MGTFGHNPLLDSGQLTFSPCRELRELELFGTPMELDSISSIESPDIKKIIIHHSSGSRDPGSDTFWMHLDDTLTELVQRPEYKLRLEVEFWGRWGAFSLKKTRLPRFVKNGRMTVWGFQNELIYSSDLDGTRK